MNSVDGRVLSVSQGRALVAVAPAAACAGCGSRGVCAGGKAQTISIAAGDWRPGEAVRLSMPTAAVNRAALAGYLLPAVTTLAGALALGGGGDVAAALGAGLGLALGLGAVRLLGRRLAGADFTVVCGTDSSTLPGVIP